MPQSYSAIQSQERKDALSSSEAPSALFTSDGNINIISFLEAIRAVVGRLLSEGYTLKDGRLVPPPSAAVFDPVPKTTEEQ